MKKEITCWAVIGLSLGLAAGSALGEDTYATPRFASNSWEVLTARFDAEPRDAEPVPANLWLTEQLRSRFAIHASDHFVLLHHVDPAWAQSVAVLLERARAQFYHTLEQAQYELDPLAEPLVWICFQERGDFDRYTVEADGLDLFWTRGYYSTRTNRVALAQVGSQYFRTVPQPVDGQTAAPRALGQDPQRNHDHEHDPLALARTTHEAAHQLAFNSGLQKRGVMYPIWVSEGLATAFESDSVATLGTPEQANPTRQRQLIAAWKARRLLPLERMIVMTQVPIDEPRALSDVYAQSWGLFHWLYLSRPAELRTYLSLLASLEPGRRSSRELRREFASVFGELAPLEREWSRFLEEQAAKPAPADDR